MITELWNWLGNNAPTIIALCALAFTAYQTTSTRRHNRLSVKPHLSTLTHRDDKSGLMTIEASLHNNGLGPAIIRSFVFEVNDDAYEFESSEEAHKFFEQIIDEDVVSLSVGTLAPGHAMKPNDQTLIFRAIFPSSNEDGITDFESFLDNSALRVAFESVYGEAFEYHTKESHS